MREEILKMKEYYDKNSALIDSLIVNSHDGSELLYQIPENDIPRDAICAIQAFNSSHLPALTENISNVFMDYGNKMLIQIRCKHFMVTLIAEKGLVAEAIEFCKSLN
jgi:hypothetical protein